MARAADLLVEERVLRVLHNPVVQSEREFADAASTVVHVDHLLEKVLAPRRRRLDHLACFEAQPHVVDLAPLEHRRIREANRPLDAVLHRAGERLAVGEVLAAARRNPCAGADADPQIGVLSDDAQLRLRLQKARNRLHARRELAPARDRIGIVEHARPVDKPLVLLEGHLRVLRRRMGRILRQHPAELPGRGTFEVAVAELLV